MKDDNLTPTLSNWRGSRRWKLLAILSLVILVIIACGILLNSRKDEVAPAQVPESALSLGSTLSERAQATGDVKFNDQNMVKNLYVVDGSSSRGNLGLSGISDLQDSGMLFFYPQEKTVNFWMKDMKINLDIIWLGCDGQVLGWQADAKPSDYPKTYSSPKLNYVLEVESGFVSENKLKVGDKFTFKFSGEEFRCEN